ncbi:DNA polymerase I [Escherichia phage M01]|nr:DNA polymerase I [Escherichia phage M01]
MNVEGGRLPDRAFVSTMRLVCETPDLPEYTVAELEKLMCELPEWAEGFPLVAEGAGVKTLC